MAVCPPDHVKRHRLRPRRSLSLHRARAAPWLSFAASKWPGEACVGPGLAAPPHDHPESLTTEDQEGATAVSKAPEACTSWPWPSQGSQVSPPACWPLQR